MDNTTTNLVSFETALSLAKIGKKIARQQFRDTCYIVVKYPTPDSQNTLPYLQMHKKVTKFKGDLQAGSVETHTEIFPVDLSCESLFADDWYVKE
ncbi:hypothetical protein EKK58_06030 [Candidatus Dependentiae bacterium]|nr:MAG: hypothetical protein EKK58_06030 [Candidatus Dependentiae bacterium]